MKKTLIIVLVAFALLLVSLIALPIIFKDKIVARIDQEIANTIDAHVFYDVDNFSLSVLKRFPNISATIEEFGVVGSGPFEGDTLAHVNSFQVDLNLFSVIFGDYPELTGLHLNGGQIYVKVLEDGTANYNIMKESEEPSAPEEPSNFKFGIDLMEVSDVNFVYDDRQLKYFMALQDFQLEGAGDFNADIYGIDGRIDTKVLKVDFDDVNYISDKTFMADTEIQVDMNQMKFSFGEGQFGVNDFLFGVNGFVAMPSDDIDIDLTFEGKENTFKSVLSLVPGIYTESFTGLNTSGTMDFGGFLKGTYSESQFPKFNIGLKVKEGMFQYPDLPRPVKDVNIDLTVKNESGNLDYTQVDIPAFNLTFGSNPISGRLFLENLLTYDVDGQLKGKLNLAELTSIFPIDGMDLKGILDVDATAKGRYDSVAEIIPAINAKMNLSNGYVKSEEYPAPIEDLNVKTSIVNSTGKMADFLVDMSNIGFKLEGEEVKGNMKVSDLDRLNWDGSVHGAVDLGKIIKIFPMEGVIMEGKIKADIDTKGSYADVETERYNKLDTRGQVVLNDFYYTDKDLPQGIRIHQAKGDFSPQAVNLTNFDARLGESPVKAAGSLSNYMAYMFEEKAVLKGKLDVNSSKFNINEWMTESESATADTTELSLIELPKNIDFSMSVQADEVLYDNLVFNDAKGQMTLKDGVLTFKDAGMKTMGGQMTLNGTYNTQNIKDPKFNMDFKVLGISIQEAFKSFNTVKAFAPIAQHLNGDFTSGFSLSGKLGQDMMPVLSSLDGSGLIEVAQAVLENSKIVSGITSLTKLKDGNTIEIKDLKLKAEIKDGMLAVSPFDIKLWDYKAKVQGSTGFDGSINYLVNMEIPAGKLGSQANNLLASLSGTEATGETKIPLAINLGGTYQQPKVGLAGGESMETMVANALKARASSEGKKLQDQLTEQFKAQEDSAKQEMKVKADAAQDSAKKELNKKVEEAQNKATDEVKDLVKGLFGKSKTSKDTTKSNQ
ncbi:AsmA-like C-terminal region-containing protein [Echinicola shivajiensis]|uniref:AsmA-like C-terminal region-containing protein n=1 Tax=Echinicola shivajiensis TaxID=1035916 RepID=UPI001BFCD1C2|nr:AsmA-like C-terminal region-containing protein [Echinicola shivajiensis]